MAIVNNQNIPTTTIEDELDPEIEFKDQYRRLLCEGLPISAAPAGVELVTYTKKDSRPATRDVASPGPSAGQIEQRDKFRECLDCWRRLPASDESMKECGLKRSKGHRDDIDWLPGSGGTTFHNWMSDCLKFKAANPDEPFPDCPGVGGCANPLPFGLVYSSLVMACGEEQSFSVDPGAPGCPPYVWRLAGGGSLVEVGDGVSAVYRAPGSNPGCGENPTISAFDACGIEASVRVAVNCFVGGVAYKEDGAEQTQCWWDAWNEMCFWEGTGYCDQYGCDGALIIEYHFPVRTMVMYGVDCNTHVFSQGECTEKCDEGPMVRCPGGWCEEDGWGYHDVRTEEQKAGGCCPLNPATGLPF